MVDETLRARLVRSLASFSIFETQNDKEALRTLRLVDIDVILRESTGPAGALATFVASVREITAGATVIAVGATGEEESAADFVVPEGFTARELDAVLRHALDRQRLLRELTVTRAPRPTATPAATAAEEGSWDHSGLARVLRGFTGVLGAGFDLPRALGMFLDAIGEVVEGQGAFYRIVDDSGEDYLYPISHFKVV